MSRQISVILCTHNPHLVRLSRTLAALAGQDLDQDKWEVVLVDNASSVAFKDCTVGHRIRHLRVVRENRLGLTHARCRGINESLGKLLVFVDDDNLLRQNYLSAALTIAADFPHLGVWGGSIEAEFETAPPVKVQPYLRLLALRKIEAPLWSNVRTTSSAEPWGAGMCLRTDVALAYLRHCEAARIEISDRKGSSLLSGGDSDICSFVCSKGLGMAVFPQLTLIHIIPPGRLTEDYLMKIAEGISISHYLLEYKWSGEKPKLPPQLYQAIKLVYAHLVKSGIEKRMHLSSLRAPRKALQYIEEWNATPTDSRR